MKIIEILLLTSLLLNWDFFENNQLLSSYAFGPKNRFLRISIFDACFRLGSMKLTLEEPCRESFPAGAGKKGRFGGQK